MGPFEAREVMEAEGRAWKAAGARAIANPETGCGGEAAGEVVMEIRCFGPKPSREAVKTLGRREAAYSFLRGYGFEPPRAAYGAGT